jgi:CobQ-like glutamine amidotransferase family enzyme
MTEYIAPSLPIQARRMSITSHPHASQLRSKWCDVLFVGHIRHLHTLVRTHIEDIVASIEKTLANLEPEHTVCATLSLGGTAHTESEQDQVRRWASHQ